MGTSGTNAYLILSIFSFYIFLFVVSGLVGSNLIQTSVVNTTPPTPDGITFLTQISYFFQGIAFSIGNLPLWANTLLFLPLGMTIVYIILSWLRGSS